MSGWPTSPRLRGLAGALDPLVGALLGVVVFLSCFGTTVLDPSNVGWLMKKGDTTQASTDGQAVKM